MTIRLDAHRPEFHRAAPPQLPVRVATTGNLTISTGLNAGDTVDGVTLAAGDRVLVKDQSTGSQNGIYIAGATPARAFDFEEGAAAYGALIWVVAGTANGQTLWVCTNTTVPTIGTTVLTFAEFTSGGGASLSDDDPEDVGSAPDPGVGTEASRWDHVHDGTHAHEPPTPGVHKILVKRTSDFTTAASNDSVPDYDTVIDDTMTDSWWDAGDPDGFVVTADYDGLDAIFMAKVAWADPNTSPYVELKLYYFPAASGRNRPISSSTDEDYLIAVEQQPAVDGVNHFIHVQSDPITVGTGDRLFCAIRNGTAQTAIDYNGRVSITLGAYIVGSGSAMNTVIVQDEGTPLATSATTLNFVGSGVVASGTGTTKTITISGGGSSSGVPPPILLESGHAVPFTFDDILQASDGSDFLWASE